MTEAIERYLDRVMIYANRRDPAVAARVRAELKDHLDLKVEAIVNEGVPREDAVFRALEAHGDPKRVGYGLRPRFPLIDIRTHGTARGVIAVGPRAVGVVACGGAAMGVVTFAGVGAGVVGIGGIMASLFYAYAGVGLAPLGVAYAGIALGLIALGGVAVGYAASGGVAVGYVATGAVSVSAALPEQAPSWLVDRAAPTDFTVWIWFTAANVVAFIVLWLFCSAAMWTESRRLRKADPRLAD